MKKIFFPGVLLALLFIFSCNKDEFTEDQAVEAQKDLISYQDSIDQVRDSLEKVGGILQFSVSVVPVDGSVGFVSDYKSADSEAMLAGATVSVSQHGQVLTSTTDESGIAVFTDLRVGTLNVAVRADGYTSANFIVAVNPTSYDIGDAWNLSGVLRHAATMVPVFNLSENTSNISGVLTYETDLTNDAPEIAEGVNVIAMVDVNDSDFVGKYFYDLYANDLDSYMAVIKQIAYNELIASAVTDADGMYSIDMPSAADGLPIMLEVDDVVTDQELLLNDLYGVDVFGVQTIRTLFSSNVGASGGPTASSIDYVKAAYVEFGAPTGVVTQQPLVAAVATAIIGESGIAAIVIVNQGNGYTQAPKLVITGDGEDAEAVAYITEGKVTSVEITNAGKGYTNAAVAAVSSVETMAEASPVVSYGITEYDMVDGGDGYKSVPDVIITSSSGSGASATAVMSGYVDTIKVTNQGSGYVCPPHVQVARGTGVLATATAGMTMYNPLYSVELSQDFIDNQYYETVPSVEIETDGTTVTGSGATAVVQLETAGEVDRIELSNPGAGYVELPTVILTGGNGVGAVAQALWLDKSAGTIKIDILEGGEGYSANPSVQISAPPAGGTAPVVANVVRTFQIAGITLTNPGSGYNIAYITTTGEYNNEPAVVIDGMTLADGDVIVRPNMKLETVAIGTRGTQYDAVNPPSVVITPKCGYGTGAVAMAEVLMEVEDVIAVNTGSGYIALADIEVVIVTPPEGCENQAEYVADELGEGVLTEVILDNEGLGYLAPPMVVLMDGSTEVETLQATVSNGVITGVDVGDVTGLDFPNNYTIVISTFGMHANFGLDAYPQSGKISFVEISNPGAGYSSAPMVRFVRLDDSNNPIETGSFVDAEATAVIADGRVVGINITNPGTGYYYSPGIEIYVPNTLEVAKGTISINDDGYITGISVTGSGNSQGQGYAEAPSVTIRASVPGMGSGATATAVVANGIVTKVVMTDNGSGYLGKNNPGTAQGVSFKPSGAALSSFDVYAGKSYIKDIYLGTGVRNEDSN